MKMFGDKYPDDNSWDPAHEADMRALRKEQLEADCGSAFDEGAYDYGNNQDETAWGDYDEPNYDYDEEY